MTTEAQLAKCLCGAMAATSCIDNDAFFVRCPACMAKTPDFGTKALADAAWNRMMANTDDKITWVGEIGCPHARHLLSALADELDNSVVATSAQRTVLFEMQQAIRKVLSKNP